MSTRRTLAGNTFLRRAFFSRTLVSSDLQVPTVPDITNLQTTIKNPTSRLIRYVYLGSHGVKVLAGAHYSFTGTIEGQLILAGGSQYIKRRTSYENDLLNSRIELVKTPAVIVKDATTAAAKVLTLNNTTLGSGDPSFGAFTDS